MAEARFLVDSYREWVAREGVPVVEDFGLDLLGMAVRPWPRQGDGVSGRWGAALKDLMDLYPHYAGWWIIGEAMPLLDNAVSLDPRVTDRWALPAARITHRWDANDLRLMADGTRVCTELLQAAGATDVVVGPIGEAHLAGTCRMGADPRTSVVNASGQAHQVPNLFVADGSVFVTNGSANNTLTSLAVSTHIAESLLALAARGEI